VHFERIAMNENKHRLASIVALVMTLTIAVAATVHAQSDTIRAKCAQEWPTDFVMRVYCEKQQAEAAGQLNTRAMSSSDEQMIRSKCAADWPTDYSMRDYCEVQQLKALHLLAQTERPTRQRVFSPDSVTRTLLGQTEAELRTSVGEPKEIAGHRWAFDTEEDGTKGELKVYFGDNGKVNEVKPDDVPLTAVKRRTKPPTVATTEVIKADPVPSEAVARCGNGAYVYVSTGPNTCKGYGGVSEWFNKPK